VQPPLRAEELVRACWSKAADFRSGLPVKDDLTLMALERL
jgi:hypothetical protein